MDRLKKRQELIQNQFSNKRKEILKKNFQAKRDDLVELKRNHIFENILQKLDSIFQKEIKFPEFPKLPEIQKITGEVTAKISNLPLIQKIEGLIEAKIINWPEKQKVEIENLPETQKVEVINQPKIPEEISIKNLPQVQKVEITNQKEIKIPEYPKTLEIENLPLAKGQEASKQADPTKYIPVRFTDGRQFKEGAGGEITSSILSQRADTVIRDPEYKERKLRVTSEGKIPVEATINVGDIEIGAVEIKDHDSDTRANVGNNGLEVEVKASTLPSGAATSANQQPPSTTPTVYNLTLTNTNTEYSQELPTNTRELRFRCRTLYDVRYAWETGKVATPTAPYLTLPAGSDYWSDWNNLSSKTLYFASSTVGVVIELEVFTA